MPIESEIVCIRIISLAMHFISSFLSPKHLLRIFGKFALDAEGDYQGYITILVLTELTVR